MGRGVEATRRSKKKNLYKFSSKYLWRIGFLVVVFSITKIKTIRYYFDSYDIYMPLVENYTVETSSVTHNHLFTGRKHVCQNRNQWVRKVSLSLSLSVCLSLSLSGFSFRVWGGLFSSLLRRFVLAGYLHQLHKDGHGTGASVARWVQENCSYTYIGVGSAAHRALSWGSIESLGFGSG